MPNDPPIIFSRHALIKLEQRRLTKEVVVKTIGSPSYLTTAGENTHAFRKFGKLYLKVIFTRTQNSIMVITQHWVSELP
ncbi:MAG: hypothetical protein A3C07_01790 [Candidatus Sungbacteria bacterium RIFCSPHIGHO2_02_FULL_47_11]|uniref:DUF4258 domain-containing protein n=1 Tax=Candidatus Sungbacteria bacterium RIFCSPHIGHO2_02_FULL_47_11 TaxID=1802270 RepID=A0A1G2KP19_9BACT|nr:MAG: hypothetical protein A3C07_01790 [Candidatus Sungbacteria bacterium RIFCSPHIGHO2_02_FULL_47_11]